MPVDIENLHRSYEAYLRAKIQEKEFASWGGSITDSFRKVIANHQAAEAEYLAEEIERRRAR